MRVIQESQYAYMLGRRITPAHAGNTNFTREAKEAQQDHPRACG